MIYTFEEGKIRENGAWESDYAATCGIVSYGRGKDKDGKKLPRGKALNPLKLQLHGEFLLEYNKLTS